VEKRAAEERFRAMKRILALVVVLYLVSACEPPQIVTEAELAQLAELRRLYSNKQYFELRDEVAEDQLKESPEMDFYRGAVANKFLQLEESIEGLKRFQQKGNQESHLTFESYKVLAGSYVMSCRYGAAADTFEAIVRDFGDRLDDAQKADLENSAALFGCLREVPEIKVHFDGDSSFQTTDGRWPIQVNGVSMHLGPDTGAEFSFIIRSRAEGLGMNILPARIDVKNIHGETVFADLGVANLLSVGNVSLENVVFLVFEDSDPYFAEASLQIVGALGLPVISALGQVTFSSDGQVVIPENPSECQLGNLCVSDLSPIVLGLYEGDRLSFVLDTGAGESTLWAPFLERYGREIEGSAQRGEKRLGGVGGIVTHTGYFLNDFTIELAGKPARLSELFLHQEHTTDESRFFFGNIGRDLVFQFDRLTLNFASMCFAVE
jgi:hypothetical protein